MPRKRSIPSWAACATAKTERRAEGRDLTIAVAGCVAQAEGEEIIRRQPAVDIVVGPAGLSSPARAAGRRSRARRRSVEGGKRLPGAGVLDTEFPPESKFDHLPAPQGMRAGSAFLSIQEGCDKFCTFCVVPYTRGAEYSRPVSAVLARGAPARRGRRDRDSRCSARTSTPITARRPNDGSTWSLARLIRALGRDRGAGAHPLHDLASARHGRRSDRRAWRRAAAHAVPAPAGAVGLGSHPRGDEPPATAAISTSASSIACATRAPTSRCRRTSSSAFRVKAMPISTTRCG